jgi:hypothetical protein
MIDALYDDDNDTIMDGLLTDINNRLDQSCGFKKVGRSCWGGTKHPQTSIALAAFNHINADYLRDVIAGADWPEGSAYQLLVKDEEETFFTEWMRKDYD